jgi:surface antigen
VHYKPCQSQSPNRTLAGFLSLFLSKAKGRGDRSILNLGFGIFVVWNAVDAYQHEYHALSTPTPHTESLVGASFVAERDILAVKPPKNYWEGFMTISVIESEDASAIQKMMLEGSVALIKKASRINVIGGSVLGRLYKITASGWPSDEFFYAGAAVLEAEYNPKPTPPGFNPTEWKWNPHTNASGQVVINGPDNSWVTAQQYNSWVAAYKVNQVNKSRAEITLFSGAIAPWQ